MPTEQHSYDELHGEGWTRLLAAARRKLERTSGALDGEIGLLAPSDAERRTVIGVTESHGRIAPGYRADLVVLDDEYRVQQSWVGGVAEGGA